MSTAFARAERFFDRYAYPEWLREHSRAAGRVAAVLAEGAVRNGVNLDPAAVTLAALLHDVGRSPLVDALPAEHHDRSAVVLMAEGLPDLVEPARRHPVYAFGTDLAPRTLAEKIVNLADRRAGLRIMSVRDRMSELALRHPEYAPQIPRALEAALALEREVHGAVGVAPEELG